MINKRVLGHINVLLETQIYNSSLKFSQDTEGYYVNAINCNLLSVSILSLGLYSILTLYNSNV